LFRLDDATVSESLAFARSTTLQSRCGDCDCTRVSMDINGVGELWSASLHFKNATCVAAHCYLTHGVPIARIRITACVYLRAVLPLGSFTRKAWARNTFQSEPATSHRYSDAKYRPALLHTLCSLRAQTVLMVHQPVFSVELLRHMQHVCMDLVRRLNIATVPSAALSGSLEPCPLYTGPECMKVSQ
jgi:hypothetical protein